MADTRTQIIDLAERSMRLRGYHAVSFRDLADELGIKSASIHYHFRHKHDLGAAVVTRYSEQVGEALGVPGAMAWPQAVARFCAVYLAALHGDGLQCLCSMLSAESRGLPIEVAEPVAVFYRRNLAWLEASGGAKLQALRLQAEVQGGMSLAVALQDVTILQSLIDKIKADLD